MRSLFFALWPEPALRAALHAQALLLQRAWGGRPVPPSGYHLTLHFFGRFPALPQALLDQARAAAARVALPGFELWLDQAASFPRNRVGWLGCVQPPGALPALARALAPARGGAGAAGADPFVPHVTVLRGVGGLQGQAIARLHWPVAGFRLLATAPAQRPADAAPYETLGAWALRAG